MITDWISTRLSSNKFNVYLPRYKTNKLLISFRYQGVKIWNSISDHLRQIFLLIYLKNILLTVIKHYIYHDLNFVNLYSCEKKNRISSEIKDKLKSSRHNRLFFSFFYCLGGCSTR